MTQKSLGKILVDQAEYEMDKWIAMQARSEWVPLCPDYPNLKGLTCKEIDHFINTYSREVTQLQLDNYTSSSIMSLISLPKRMLKGEFPRQILEDYLHHVTCLDRDEIYSICKKLGEEIERQYGHKLQKVLTANSTICVTTPRGGYSALSIFAYANDLGKTIIPSDIITEYPRYISKQLHIANTRLQSIQALIHKKQSELERMTEHDEDATKIFNLKYKVSELEGRLRILHDFTDVLDHKLAHPEEIIKIGTNWLGYTTTNITDIFIIDDIIASGQQMHDAYIILSNFFGYDIPIVPVVIAGRRKSRYSDIPQAPDQIIGIETTGISDYLLLKEKGLSTKDKTITVRFPWGSPDGISDRMLLYLYGSRHMEPRRLSRKLGRITESEDVTLLI